MHPKSRTAFGVFFVANACGAYSVSIIKTTGGAGAHRHGANALCVRITRIGVKKLLFGQKKCKNP